MNFAPKYVPTTITTLYAFGSNGAGQLGVGHQDDLDQPQECLFTMPRHATDDSAHPVTCQGLHDPIKCLAAGGNHTLVLTTSGNLYASGTNEHGRCGIPGDDDILTTFTHVLWGRSRNVTHVAATWEASFFVEDDHLVWTCGRGLKGELGLGLDVLHSPIPRLVLNCHQHGDDKLGVVSISAGMGHVVVVLSDGTALGWGSCRKGQLGDEFKASKVLWSPAELHIPLSPTRAVCGRDFTIFVESDRRFVLHGDLKENDDTPRLRSIDAAPQLYAGWSTVYTLHRGLVRGFGQGRKGQLPPLNVPRIVHFAAGSEHSVAVSEDNKLLTWGWGEHGNCSTPLDERKCVTGRFNVVSIPIDESVKLIGVGAGCASSFVWTTDGKRNEM